jgi:dUTP pyrophosphatase
MKIVLDHGAFPPERAHEDDAGLDIRSPVDVIIKPHASVLIDTGVHVAIPRGCVGFLKSKSGLMCNHDITSDGTVDAGYTGSIRVKLFKHGEWHYTIRRGDKITQLVVQRCEFPDVEIVDSLPETARGAGGLGSTGR